MRLSQSALSAADKCLLSAQYTLDTPVWVKRVAGSDRAAGTGYHAGLQVYYDQRMKYPAAGLLPQLDEMIPEAKRIFDVSTEIDLYDNTPVEEFRWSEKIPDRATAHRFIEQMLTHYVQYRDPDGNPIWWPLDWIVLGVEVHQTVAIPELHPNVAKFGADLVLEDPHGWIVIADQKTGNKTWDQGKHHPRKNVQAPYYQRLAREVYPGAPGYRFVFDIMYLPGPKKGVTFERRISDPTPAHEAAVMRKASDFLALYEEMHVRQGRDLPANPSSSLCNPKWCDFWEGCPHGAVLDN